MSDENKIKVIYVQAAKKAEVAEIGTELRDMQAVVGGDIEQFMPFSDEAAIVCNGEGKLNGLPLNRAIYDDEGRMLDIIAGDFFICYAPIESETFESLPNNLLEKYEEKFRCPEDFFKGANGIKVFKAGPQRDDLER